MRVRENSKKKIVGSERQEPLGNIVDELMDFHSAPPHRLQTSGSDEGIQELIAHRRHPEGELLSNMAELGEGAIASLFA